MNPRKIDILHSWSRLNSVTYLKSSISVSNFMESLVSDFSNIPMQFTDLTKNRIEILKPGVLHEKSLSISGKNRSLKLHFWPIQI